MQTIDFSISFHFDEEFKIQFTIVQVQRKIGLKAIDLGANAVIGYTQCFDLEGDVGVVARGVGTAVTLIKIQEQFQQPLPEKSAFVEE